MECTCSSRSLTIINAIKNIDSLSCKSFIYIVVAGADSRECQGTDFTFIRKQMKQLFEYLNNEQECSIKLVFLGPNISQGLCRLDPLCYEYKDIQIEIQCNELYLDDYLSTDSLDSSGIDLVVCFQGGIWAYNSWSKSLEMCLLHGYVVLITSYNEYESEDDEDKLHEIGVESIDWIWNSTKNANECKCIELFDTSLLDRELIDNAYSQCFQRTKKDIMLRTVLIEVMSKRHLTKGRREISDIKDID